MPTPTDIANGAPVWLDLQSSDTARSIEFYSGLLGWTHETAGAEFNDYVTFSKNGHRVAGMVANRSGTPDLWTVYLKTADAEATATAIVQHGGQVFFSHAVPGLGTMVGLADPSGAQLGAWQPGGHSGFDLVNEASAPVWHELHATDYDGALEFYRDAFGWTTTTMSDTPDFRMSTFSAGGDPLAGIFDATGSLAAGQTARWMPYFGVEDADAAASVVTGLGGTQLDPVTDSPFGRMTHLEDSTGAPLTIIQVG
ncbi:VOC family protein [Lacisediminihabitans sp. H27-G8]|uniref:VOC family protein n=1 Tax=Lacisediminihabitans sp. H27-G8 TaxID=3111909 RepID=UPI0038FC2559